MPVRSQTCPETYRHTFACDEVDSALACMDEHGFAVVRRMLSAEQVATFKELVRRAANPDGSLADGESRTITDFVDREPEVLQLIDHEPWLNLQRRMLGSDALTVHRTACIIRMPGSGGCGWHSDYAEYPDNPRIANDVLNAHELPNGKWFYLTGSDPDHGGLAVIPGSHRLDWEGPEGYQLATSRKTFRPLTEDARARDPMKVPGAIPVRADPGDMILFAARTFHAAYPNRSTSPRLSFGVGLRPSDMALQVPWGRTPSAMVLEEQVPERYRAYVRDYRGVDRTWAAS